MPAWTSPPTRRPRCRSWPAPSTTWPSGLEESVTIISEDRDRSREFLADVSHELRTPIAALTNVQRAACSKAPPRYPRHATSSCAAAASRSSASTGCAANLLELSKLDSGLVALQLRDEDLRIVAEDAVDHAEPMAERKGVELRTHLPADAIIQPHDPPRLGQVLGNLIGNAIKFTPSGGHIDVSVARDRGWCQLQVKDDGVGIDPNELEHVFDRFYRGTRRPEERAGGSGLGLAIARSIVDMHHGRISISSTPDVGTEVRVTLPRDVLVSSPPTLGLNPARHSVRALIHRARDRSSSTTWPNGPAD